MNNNTQIKVWQWVVTIIAIGILVWVGIKVFSKAGGAPVTDKCALCA